MKIKWALNELTKYNDEPLKLSGEVEHLESYLTEHSTDILAVASVQLDGYLFVENQSEYIVDARISVQLTMPSSRSLEAVEVDVTIPFSEIYLAPKYTPKEDTFDENEIVIELDSEQLDLRKPIIDSIIAGLPTQVFTKEELEDGKMPAGKSWKVVSEVDHRNGADTEKSKEDSPFAALKDLFPEEDND